MTSKLDEPPDLENFGPIKDHSHSLRVDRRSKTANAFFWSFVERIGSQALRSAFAIILARLLLPRDFGLVAISFVFLGVAEVIMTSGFGTALIRKKVLNHVDECSIFYFNVVVGAILTAVLFYAAPYIAAFYRLPDLAFIGRVAAFSLFINAFGVVPGCLLARRLDFFTLCKVSIASTIISGFLAIALAWKGFGVWSIVAQLLVSSLANLALLWGLANWRPIAGFSFRSLRTMFGFGSSFACISLLDVLARNLSSAIIGRRFTMAEVGLYSRATQIGRIPGNDHVFCGVSSPASPFLRRRKITKRIWPVTFVQCLRIWR